MRWRLDRLTADLRGQDRSNRPVLRCPEKSGMSRQAVIAVGDHAGAPYLPANRASFPGGLRDGFSDRDRWLGSATLPRIPVSAGAVADRLALAEQVRPLRRGTT